MFTSEKFDSVGIENNDNDESIQSQAFVRPLVVEGEDLSVPPMDGMQYLRRVIEESKKYGMVVANVQSKPQRCNTLPYVPEKKQCSSSLLLGKHWQISAMADFSRLRLDTELLRQKIHDSSLKNFKSSLPYKDNEEEWLQIVLKQGPGDTKCPTEPSTRLCLAISQVTIWRLLSYFVDWLEEGVVKIQDGCRWIYCLLVCLELPVAPDIYFTLRQIARTLINYRSQLENPESSELPYINLLVCIISRHFSQVDLADPFESNN